VKWTAQNTVSLDWLSVKIQLAAELIPLVELSVFAEPITAGDQEYEAPNGWNQFSENSLVQVHLLPVTTKSPVTDASTPCNGEPNSTVALMAMNDAD